MGYSPQHVAAIQKWQRLGSFAIDEVDVIAIENESPEDGLAIRRSREERDRHRRAAAERQKNAPVSPQRHAQPYLRAVAWREGESWGAYAKRCAAHPAPIALIDGLWSAAIEHAEKIADANAALEARVKAIERQVAELEQRPAQKAAGVWNADVEYIPGDLVSHGGSGWVSNWKSKGIRPGTNSAWTLFVQRGKDGKDLRG